MNSSPESVRFDDASLPVGLVNGRTLSAPLACFPRLLNVGVAERLAAASARDGLLV